MTNLANEKFLVSMPATDHNPFISGIKEISGDTNEREREKAKLEKIKNVLNGRCRNYKIVFGK